MGRLTIEQKAKAYDEAINRASGFKSQEIRDIVEHIFPELRENEDEKIRKNCIHFLKLQKQHHAAAFEIEECISWLEEQGKQKSVSNQWKPSKEQCDKKSEDKAEPIIVRDFNSVFSKEQVEEIDKRIEESQRLYNAKLRDEMRKVKDFPMTD